MTADPLTAVLDQLAACREHLSQLDAREAGHFAALSEQLAQLAGLITTMGRTLADDTAALARLEALDRQVTDLAAAARRPGADGKDRYQPGPAPAWWKLTPAERQQPLARAAGLGRGGVPARLRPPGRHPRPVLGAARPVPVRARHRQPAVDGALPPARPQHRPAVRPGRIPGPHPARLRRPADGRDHRLRPRPGPHAAQPLHLEHAMTNPALRQALACAARGWPVFPCLPGQKIPATRHGYLDATTDTAQITAWFGRQPGWNLAIATGAPGPDVLDVDQHGPAGNGFGAFARLRAAGLLRRRQRLHPHPQRRPARLLHRLGPAQRPPARQPPRLPVGRRLRPRPALPGRRPAVRADQDPRRPRRPELAAGHPPAGTRAPVPAASIPPAPRPRDHPPGRWVAAQPEGNRNAGLFWAANRALDADPAADLSELAAAARQAGLPEPEITRTLDSARRTRQAHPEPPDHQAEGAS